MPPMGGAVWDEAKLCVLRGSSSINAACIDELPRKRKSGGMLPEVG